MVLWLIINSSLVVLTSIILAIYLWGKHNANYWKRHGVPHKNILPLFGNYFGLLTGKKGIIDIFAELYNDKASDHLPIIGCNIFHKPALMIKDPELIKTVLMSDFHLFTNRYCGSNLTNDKIGGNVLFFLKDLKWKTLRTRLNPTFSNAKLKQMFYLKAEVGNELAELLQTNNSEGKNEIDVNDVAGRYMTDVIATCAFGIQVNSLKNPDSEFRTHGKRIFETTFRRAIEFLGAILIPQVNNILKFEMLSAETTNFFRSLIPQVMDERQKTGIVRNDFLEILISFRKQYQEDQTKHVQYGPNDLVYDDDLLIAQSIQFFAAGFETSSSTVSFSLYELAKHTHIQEKVRAEIKTKLKEYDGNISYEYIDSLEYLNQVIAETLRMYPPVVYLDRMYGGQDKKTNFSLEPYYNFEIPHGMPLIIPVFAIHMDQKIFPEPEKYDPDRFLDESIFTNGTYLPFGLGPRKCIGERFGLIQTKVALVNILKDNFVAPCDNTPKIIKFDRKAFTIKSDTPIWLKIIPDITY